MGKDIDRNITRQLWERFKNTFSRNDVIPVENGGTGVNNLELFYQKLVSDQEIKYINLKDIPLEPGFTLQNDSTASFSFNKKSMYIEGVVHIIRGSNITSKTFMKFNITGINNYSINNIKIGSFGTRMSINNNILSLSGNFNSENSYYNRFNIFIPYI